MKQPARSRYHSTHSRTTPAHVHTTRSIAACACNILHNGIAIESSHKWEDLLSKIATSPVLSAEVTAGRDAISESFCFCSHPHLRTHPGVSVRPRAQVCEHAKWHAKGWVRATGYVRYLAQIPEQMRVRSVRTRNERRVPHVILHVLIFKHLTARCRRADAPTRQVLSARGPACCRLEGQRAVG